MLEILIYWLIKSECKSSSVIQNKVWQTTAYGLNLSHNLGCCYLFTALKLRMVFIFVKHCEERKEYVIEILYGSQSLKYLLFGPLQKMCAYPCSRCKSYTGLSILRLAVNEFQSECWKQTTVLKSNTVVIFFQPAPLTEASPSSSELGHQVTGPAPTSTSKLGEGRRSPLHGAKCLATQPPTYILCFILQQVLRIAANVSSCF